MVAVILQARINSTRLPGKALLDLAGKPLIVRVMENLSRIPADQYILACDIVSEEAFAPLAEACGFILFPGDPEDVLDRYCSAIRVYKPDIVIRATGDNPFVFAEAAKAAVERFTALRKDGVSYFGFDGLPYGAGVEIINANDLLDAAARTGDPYDREHVGPALYNHRERYQCIREPAPVRWKNASLRLTVDTKEDYARVCTLTRLLVSRGVTLPAPSSAVIEAARSIHAGIVVVPATGGGKGSGHLVRCAELVRSLRTAHHVSIVYPEGAQGLPPDLEDCARPEVPAEAGLVVADLFRSTRKDLERLIDIGPVVTLDDGGPGRVLADYCIDTIPSLGFPHRPNIEDPAFLPLPQNRKKPSNTAPREYTVLVTGGGCDEAGLAKPAAEAAADLFSQVTLIAPEGNTQDNTKYTTIAPIPNLREHLATYDLVITHYGLTAFEALAAGCRVILFSPTRYHWRLARKGGFAAFPPGNVSVGTLKKILQRGIPVPSVISPATEQRNLAEHIASLVTAKRFSCPLCGSPRKHSRILHRRERDSIVRCSNCGMLYVSFQIPRKFSYNLSYFFDQYRSQYGKTYLDDFDTIRDHGRKRMETIIRLQRQYIPFLDEDQKRLLDIGCAYGPFLAAAQEAGWHPAGTDISAEAVEWVCTQLGLPAIRSAFPAFSDDLLAEKRPFAVVTLWYVIEHFEDLEPVFAKIRQLLIPGGLLAFSTPSASGISARKNRCAFFDSSPADHFTLWEPRRVKAQLEHYGFRLVYLRSTGHHPERFPGCSQLKPGTVIWNIVARISRIFRLGDTFEVYAVKRGTLEDVQ